MKIGQRIKERRKELKISADELGKRIGKDRSTVYRYENGDIENMPFDVLEPIAKALDTTQQYLMGWTSKEKEETNKNISDIIIRLRTDKEFLSVVEALYSIDLDNDKATWIKQMLTPLQND